SQMRQPVVEHEIVLPASGDGVEHYVAHPAALYRTGLVADPVDRHRTDILPGRQTVEPRGPDLDDLRLEAVERPDDRVRVLSGDPVAVAVPEEVPGGVLLVAHEHRLIDERRAAVHRLADQQQGGRDRRTGRIPSLGRTDGPR